MVVRGLDGAPSMENQRKPEGIFGRVLVSYARLVLLDHLLPYMLFFVFAMFWLRLVMECLRFRRSYYPSLSGVNI